MTKNLKETFNLPITDKEKVEQAKNISKNVKKEMADIIISSEDIEKHDEKMEEYSSDAYNWAKEIYDAGMDVPSQHAADMFSAAATMMKIALESQDAIISKKLKLKELELKNKKIEADINGKNPQMLSTSDDTIYANREDILKDKEDD